jgi:GNAT superfamily N-acetyltransferase
VGHFPNLRSDRHKQLKSNEENAAQTAEFPNARAGPTRNFNDLRHQRRDSQRNLVPPRLLFLFFSVYSYSISGENRAARHPKTLLTPEAKMIRRCDDREFNTIWAIINDGARAYKGVIPPDRCTEPYMSKETLQHEIDDGVVFWGYEDAEILVGVMGIQDVGEATLIRHAYVRTTHQSRGIGGQLLSHLRQLAKRPVLIGTWADAKWAIAFYQKHGFRVVSPAEKERLLPKYWKIPERQIETSVVLAESTAQPE